MDHKWFFDYLDRTGVLYAILLIGMIGGGCLIAYMNSDDYIISEMGDIAIDCKSASMSYDFDKAYMKLAELESLSQKCHLEKAKEIVKETSEYIFNSEAMYLCAKGDKASLDRIIFLLSSVPIRGVGGVAGNYYDNRETEKYSKSALEFNQKCDLLIDLAIANRKYDLTERVIPLFKSIPIDKNSRIFYSDSIRDNAIKKVNEAVKKGIFPNVSK